LGWNEWRELANRVSQVDEKGGSFYTCSSDRLPPFHPEMNRYKTCLWFNGLEIPIANLRWSSNGGVVKKTRAFPP